MSGEVTAQNVGLLASWLIDHPMTDDSDSPTSPLNAHVETQSQAVNTEPMVTSSTSTRAPLAQDRCFTGLHSAPCGLRSFVE